MVLKEFEKLNQDSKGCSWHEEKRKVLLTRFFYSFELVFGHCQLLPPGKCEEEHENYFFPFKMVHKKSFLGQFCPENDVFPELWMRYKYQSVLSALVCYVITGLLKVFWTPLLHLQKTFLGKCYCLLKPYYMVLCLFSLIVPSSHVITTPVCGICNSSGWYIFM